MATLNERIKEARKNLGLSQKDFAEKVGLSQRSVSWGEQPGNNVPDSTIKSLCIVFHINETWLRTGNGSMFIEPDTFSLDQYAKDRGASELELAIAKAYFDLPQDVRSQMLAKLKSLLNGEAEAAAELDTTVHERTEPDIAAELAELKRQNQELIAKVGAMEEEDALLELTDRFSISHTESAGNLSPRGKK